MQTEVLVISHKHVSRSLTLLDSDEVRCNPVIVGPNSTTDVDARGISGLGAQASNSNMFSLHITGTCSKKGRRKGPDSM